MVGLSWEAEASSDPHSPPPHALRSSSSTSASASAAKRTRSQPDLSRCHACSGLCCGRRLRLLPSEWRIVLLCPPCLALFHAKSICSYCLSPAADAPSLDCRCCSSRIHRSCVSREHRYLSPSETRAGAFTCVDCNALPQSFAVTGFLCSLENAAREAKLVAEEKALAAAQARGNATKKKEVASKASERATILLDAVVAKRDTITVKQNAELARQLHLEMNGSRRISCSRSGFNEEAGQVPTLPLQSNGARENEEDGLLSDSSNSRESDWTSADSINGENGDMVKSSESGWSSFESLFGESLFSDSVSGENEDPWKEDNKEGDYILAAESNNMNDRYSVKYSRKKPKLKETVIKEEHQPVPCWQNYSAKACQSSPDVPCGNSVV